MFCVLCAVRNGPVLRLRQFFAAFLPAFLISSLFFLSFFPFRSISPQGLKEHFLTVAALVLAGEGPEQGLAQDFFVSSTWLRWALTVSKAVYA